MADDALFPIRTASIGSEIDPLIQELGWSKADLARFLGVTRTTVSRWAHGQSRMDERQKAAVLFLQRALEAETEKQASRYGGGPRPRRFRKRFGKWALSRGIRGLVRERYQLEEPEGEPPPLGPDEIREIREQLGWIQAETAAFFGITHSTPAKWEDADPQVGPSTEAELIALRELAARHHADEEFIRSLWQEGVRAFMTEVVGWVGETYTEG